MATQNAQDVISAAEPDSHVRTNHTAKAKSPKEDSSPPGLHLALSLAVWLCGVMIGYFPMYASIPPEWAWPFKGLSFIFYAFGAVIALVGLRNVTNSKFLTHVAMGIGLAIPAYVFHLWARSTEAFFFSLGLRLLVLVMASFSLLYLLLSIPYLFTRPSGTILSQDEFSNTVARPEATQGVQPPKSRLEHIAGIIIATLALLTGLVPLVKAWFNIQ